MSYRIALPASSRSDVLDIVDPNSTAIQRFLRRHGLAGYEPSTMAAMLAQFDRAGAGFTFVDVGANIGLYSLLASVLFEPTKVIAFEPAPDIAQIARQLAQVNHVDVDIREQAVADTASTARLHLASGSDVSNSLIDGFKASEESVEVPTVRLDDIGVAAGGSPLIVKIDVEGYEAPVLAGARSLLDTVRPVLFVEVLNRRGGQLATAIAEQLEGLDYSCYELADEPTWTAHDSVRRSKDGHRDWMLTPEPLDPSFEARWSDWHHRLAACTPDRNSRVPVVRTSIAAFKRGGVSEVMASVRRFRTTQTDD